MLSPTNLFRLVSELVFVLLGLLLVWVAITGRYLFDPRRPAWLALGALLIFWGIRAWWRVPRTTARLETIAGAIRGGSLICVGVITTSIAWAPFGWVTFMLEVAGGILVLRGLLSAVLFARLP